MLYYYQSNKKQIKKYKLKEMKNKKQLKEIKGKGNASGNQTHNI
jgi:hypothetical protein